MVKKKKISKSNIPKLVCELVHCWMKEHLVLNTSAFFLINVIISLTWILPKKGYYSIFFALSLRS